jgi:hypothetical protein
VKNIFSGFEAAIKKDGKVDFKNDLQVKSYQMLFKMWTGKDPYAPGPNSLGEGA